MGGTPELAKLRRFSLAIGVILLLYSVAGVVPPEELKIFGIALKVSSPKILDIGVILVSLYGLFRFFYFANVLETSPWKWRAILKTDGIPWDLKTAITTYHKLGPAVPKPKIGDNLKTHWQNKNVSEESEIIHLGRVLASRFYPRIKEYWVDITAKDDFNMRLYLDEGWWKKSWKTLAFVTWENLEYSAPIWVNMIGIACWVIFKILGVTAST